MRLGEDFEFYARTLALGARLLLIPAQGYVSVVRPVCAAQVFDKTDALNSECGLIHQCIKQPPLLWGEKWPWLVAIKATDPNGTTAGVHRYKETFLAPGSVSEPRPAGRSFFQAHVAAARAAVSEPVIGAHTYRFGYKKSFNDRTT